MEDFKMDNLTLFVTIVDVIASLLIIYALFNLGNQYKRPGYILGFITTLVGIASQVFRNLTFHLSGIAPVDTDMPIWIFKDLGVLIIVATYCFSVRSKKS